MSLVVVRFHVGIMMTYIVFILSVIFVVSFVGFSSKPSPIYGGLVLIVSGGVGCGIIMNFGGSFLGLMVFLIYLGGMLVVFGYTTAMATEQYPEVWVSNTTVMGVFLLGLLMEVMLFSISGWKRISRKTPATTIVLEWSRAETGVGPSMAEGSHGWSPN